MKNTLKNQTEVNKPYEYETISTAERKGVKSQKTESPHHQKIRMQASNLNRNPQFSSQKAQKLTKQTHQENKRLKKLGKKNSRPIRKSTSKLATLSQTHIISSPKLKTNLNKSTIKQIKKQNSQPIRKPTSKHTSLTQIHDFDRQKSIRIKKTGDG